MKKIFIIFTLLLIMFVYKLSYCMEGGDAVQGNDIAVGEIKRREINFGAVPIILSDPNFGHGGGIAFLVRDIGAVGRDVVDTVVYTTNRYEIYYVNLYEPSLLTKVS